jgi:hypothetical protein
VAVAGVLSAGNYNSSHYNSSQGHCHAAQFGRFQIHHRGEYGIKGNGAPQVYLPKTVTDRHIFNQYVIRTARRDPLKAALQEKGIGTEIYYPVPMHLQECFAYLGHRAGEFSESEGAANQTLALPIYPELTEQQARYVDSVPEGEGVGDY